MNENSWFCPFGKRNADGTLHGRQRLHVVGFELREAKSDLEQDLVAVQQVEHAGRARGVGLLRGSQCLFRLWQERVFVERDLVKSPWTAYWVARAAANRASASRTPASIPAR